jgi:hypothetical protein
MTQARHLIATFEPIQYTLSTSAQSSLWGSVLGGGEYAYGQTAVIIASPASGYLFETWLGDEVEEANASVTTILITEDLEVTAKFSIDPEHWKNRSTLVAPPSTPNPLSWESKDLGNFWHQSDWLGTFFSNDRGWVYHSSLGWLYVESDGQDGYWFWDSFWTTWWWTTEQFYPWIYRNDLLNWVFLKDTQPIIRIYDLNTETWEFRKR